MSEASAKNKVTKSEQTRQRIIRTFLQMIPGRRWEKITVKEICSESNITRGTFYQYFNDIYDLMEQIQDKLLSALQERYSALPRQSGSFYLPEQFEEKFDYTPPEAMRTWFAFCRDYKAAITVLLDPDHGDAYFMKKLKNFLLDYINDLMDADGMPRDALREHFVKIYLELHFLAARTWLTTGEEEFLSIPEIINLLNTMRVGANYLTYRRAISPDFDDKMTWTE